jgi:hypothetical protein
MVAITNIKTISSSASARGHRVIFVLCAILEALIHLQSSSAECIEQAQRALASARSFQLNQQVLEIPQISALIQLIDLSCSLQLLDISQATKKAEDMRPMLEQILKDSRWRDDGSFTVPVGNQAKSSSSESTNHFTDNQESHNRLVFNWLPRQQVYALGYLLNGITFSPLNAQNGLKAEKYLKEGLGITKGKNLHNRPS